MPTVSIITATYNRPEVLRWAIESVRSQTFTDWEHIIVGDACTHDTADVVASFGDPRVRFINLAQNFGEQSGPNNAGTALASGRLIAYLNHDDLWLSDHLEKLIAYIDATDADLVYAPTLSIDTNGLSFCGKTNAEMKYDPSHFVPASLWLARRELVDQLGGWRNSEETDLRNPSQDFLFRAWRKTKVLNCHPQFTCLVFASGGRPQSYVLQDDRQHRAFFERMKQADFREELATTLAIRYGRDAGNSGPAWRKAARSIFNRGVIALGCHPDAVLNRFSRRKRGWWIDHLRELRGLPPSPRRKS